MLARLDQPLLKQSRSVGGVVCDSCCCIAIWWHILRLVFECTARCVLWKSWQLERKPWDRRRMDEKRWPKIVTKLIRDP